MKKKIITINISGKSNTGKSTLIEELSNRMAEVYIVSYDRVKRQLVGYHRDSHKELIKDITLDFFEVICKKNLPILISGFISTKEMYQTYVDIAEKYGYHFLSINLETPLELALERFRERIMEVKTKDIKISVMDEDLFLKNQLINYFIPSDAKIFDTSKMTANEIADQVMQQVEDL